MMRGLWFHPRSGLPYYRTRRNGTVKLIALPADLPHDHPDFIAAWAEAARSLKVKPKARGGSLESLWRAALDAPAARALSPAYRANIAREARLICGAANGQGGDVLAIVLKEKHIRADVVAAPDPGMRRKAWRFLFAFLIERTIVSVDPTAAVKAPARAKSDGHPPWSEDDIAAFRDRWPVGTVARAAMELMQWTGCRVSDAARIGPQMIGKDGVLEYRQTKTTDFAYVPWACALPAYAAHLEADRDAMLAALAPLAGQLTFLATRDGRPRSVKALTTLMNEACKAAEIAVTSHGLRKRRAAMLAEGGATPHQIGAWTGHQSLGEVERYTRKMDRRRAVVGTPAERKLETTPDQVETSERKSSNIKPIR